MSYVGLLLSLLASFLFGLGNVIVKYLDNIDPFTIATFRFIGIALPALSIVIYKNEVWANINLTIQYSILCICLQDPFPCDKRWLLILRSIMGASNLIIFFYGLKHMPIADVNMISAGSPIWCVIFARYKVYINQFNIWFLSNLSTFRIFLKEKLLLFDMCNMFVTLVGIVFIIR